MIDHKKVLVLAMNGPGVGAGAAWFQGVSDLFYAAEGAWLQVTFSQLGLVPENGSAVNWAQSVGVHRANEWLMFGGKATVEELERAGMVNRVFPKEGFHAAVQAHLVEMLRERDGKSMIEMKRLQNKTTRDARIVALYDAQHALSERFVEGVPLQRMGAKKDELEGELAVRCGLRRRHGLLTWRFSEEKGSGVEALDGEGFTSYGSSVGSSRHCPSLSLQRAVVT
jgi:peroxisomal 3,2-trans-enoyl-CoA isomerase